MMALRALAASSTLTPFCSAVLFSTPRSRSVSNAPGRMLLMVTLLPATVRATPARNAVKPARAGREIEAGERHLHRARGDVDDTAELALAHRVDHLLDQFYGNNHVGDHAVDHLRARQLAEVAHRRPPVVVDQDVGRGAGGEQRLLTLRRADVGRDRGDLGACQARK